MKKFLCIMLAAFTLLSAQSCAGQRYGRGDVLIHWEQLKEDASLRQFKKAKKANQMEILHSLIDRANEEYYKCKTEEDLNYLSEQMELIRFYNNQAKMKSTTITYSINSLQRKIDDVRNQINTDNTRVIVREGSNRDPYRNYGQDMD